MAIALTPNERNEYVLEEDQDKPTDDPSRTRWFYRTLTAHERKQLDNLAGAYRAGTGEIAMRLGDSNFLAIQAALQGVERFLDSQGNPVEFERAGKVLNVLGKQTDPPSERFLNRLSSEHIRELGQAIRENARLTAADIKNS